MYMVCPFKYSLNVLYKRSPIYLADDRNIIISSLKETYFKHFHMRSLNLQWSLADASKYFSKTWAIKKQKLLSSSKYLFNTTPDLIKANDIVLTFDKIHKDVEIGVIDYNVSKVIDNYIINSSLDMLCMTDEYIGTNRVVEIYLVDFSFLEPILSIEHIIKYLIIKSSVQKELIGTHITLRPYIYSIVLNKKIPIVISQDFKSTYPVLLKNVINSIENNIYYPRVSKETCTNCIFKDRCKWNIY